jgi:putative ABC transport system permease protein
MRNKVYSLLNILGLALGLGVSLIIFMYLQSELTYDKHIPNQNEIYRVSSTFTVNNREESYAGAGHGLAPLLESEYEFIDASTRIMHIDENVLFKRELIKLGDDGIGLADSNFFKVFEFPFLAGDARGALSKPQSIVITESFAKKYFGEENPVGQIISTNNYDYTVTGLIADLPANTHHKFTALISSFYKKRTPEEMLNSLWRIDAFTFLRFDKRYEPELLLSRFDQFYEKYMLANATDFVASYDVDIIPLKEVHFDTSGLQFDRPSGSKGYLYTFGAIGVLILMLACINYVNMATIRSLKRVKETGMQKVLGSGRKEIIFQILAESILLSGLALCIGLVMVELVLELTSLNQIIGKDLSLNFIEYPDLVWFLPLLTLTLALLSGSYPAVYLSRVPAIAAVKRGLVKQDRGLGMRKALVGFQFTISVAVVITALLMYQQMEFVKNKDLGFNKEDIVLIPLQDTVTIKQIPEIRKDLAQSRYVKASSMASAIPGKSMARTLVRLEGDEGKERQEVVDFMMVGTDYFKTMEIELLEGGTFKTEDLDKPEYPIILNEKAAALIECDTSVLGKRIDIIAPGREEDYSGRVIGVVRDFNAHSLHEDIVPVVITLQEENKGYLHVRVDSENLLGALNSIEKIFTKARSPKPLSIIDEIEGKLKKAKADIPFQFTFLNKDLLKLYEEEQRQSRLILFLTYLAIFISFLGLTGLASFTTSLKTKEVGIRKVLGADLRQMVRLILRDMLMLIIVSVILAIPLAYLLINGWLGNFAYKADLDSWVFILSGLTAILLAYIIISYHSVKIARTKPVNTLRYE